MTESPETVYKFRSWSDKNGKRILTEFELYLASPKDFNDPFDCRIPLNYKCLTESEILEFAEHLSRKKALSDENSVALKAKILHQLENNIDAFQDMYEEIEFKSYDNHYGVLSMSTEWDNILMWAHYADKHRGICVGFKEEKLLETGRFGAGGTVNYPKSRQYPTIHPLEGDGIQRHFKTTHHKSLDWLYENEYRLTKIFRPPHIPSKEERRVRFDPSLISEVTLGVNIDPEIKKEIVEICSQNNIIVYEAFKVESKFQIDRKKVDS